MPTPRILVAGIGNIFLADDAFGVEVARRLAERKLPETVQVTDFGIRGFDLAYAMMEGYDFTILIDAAPRGGAPGTVYLIELEDGNLETTDERLMPFPTHGMNPMSVLRMVKSMGHQPKNVLLVGCEPATLGPEEGQVGLSEQVEFAVDKAVEVVESMVERLCKGLGCSENGKQPMMKGDYNGS